MSIVDLQFPEAEYSKDSEYSEEFEEGFFENCVRALEDLPQKAEEDASDTALQRWLDRAEEE